MADLPLTNVDLIDWSAPEAQTGIRNSILYDPTNTHKFNDAPCEEYLSGKDNTWIVLGRDRPGGLDSGYGGKGHLRAGAIDIVAGRLSSLDARLDGGPVNNSFGADAARIYISQKTDVDINFSIPKGLGMSTAQSAVAIKADAVRVIARESLKLVTNTDSKLSNGENAYVGSGVQLIAKSAEEIDMQPIPKGKNVLAAFDELAKRIIQLNGIVQNFLKTQREYNAKLADHTHYEAFYAQQSSFDPNVVVQHQDTLLQQFINVEAALGKHVYNMNAWKGKYLTPVSSPDSKYINSLYHFLN